MMLHSKIPIMEFEGEEFSVFEEYKPPVETIDPIEEEETIENESNKKTTQRNLRTNKILKCQPYARLSIS